MAVRGHDIIIGTMSGSTFTAIAAVKNQSIQTQCGTIEKASWTQQDWQEFEIGRKSWSLNVSYLVLNDSTCNIEDVLKVGTKVMLMMKGRTGSYSVKGQAIVVTCKQDFQDGNLSQGAYQFKGTGPLEGH